MVFYRIIKVFVLIMHFFLKTYILLFIASSPLIYVALFVAMTPHLTPKQRWNLSRKACHIALLILLITGTFGMQLLTLLEISMDAFRIAGGIVISRMALQMLKSVPQPIQSFSKSMLIIPLAFPMISGPGAISSVLIAQGNATNFIEIIFIFLAIFLIMATFYGLFFIASWSSKFINHYALLILFKLSSIVLLSLSVNFIFQGIFGICK